MEVWMNRNGSGWHYHLTKPFNSPGRANCGALVKEKTEEGEAKTILRKKTHTPLTRCPQCFNG